jgi:hypothetical protein
MYRGTTRWLTDDELRPLLDLIPPQPAEAATDVGAEPDPKRRRDREFRGLLAVILLPWAIPIALWQAWGLLSALF